MRGGRGGGAKWISAELCVWVGVHVMEQHIRDSTTIQ